MSKTYDFPTFKRQVNYAIERRINCSIYDLPDLVTFSEYWHDDCKKHEDDFCNAVESCTDDILYANGVELELH